MAYQYARHCCYSLSHVCNINASPGLMAVAKKAGCELALLYLHRPIRCPDMALQRNRGNRPLFARALQQQLIIVGFSRKLRQVN